MVIHISESNRTGRTMIEAVAAADFTAAAVSADVGVIRHVDGLRVDNLEVDYLEEDTRPAFVLEDVHKADFSRVRAEHAAGVSIFKLKSVEDFRVHRCDGLTDMQLDEVEDRSF